MKSFERNINRRETGSVKWLRYEPDILPMWVADMDFLSPPPVTAALEERVLQGVFGYPEEDTRCAEAMTTWLWEKYRWQVTPDDIILLPGVVNGFNLAAQACASPGEGILFQPPAYKPFFDVAPHGGFEEHQAPLIRTSSGRYVIDKDLFRSAVLPHTAVFLLCNPHNPTGRVLDRSELTFLAETCLKNDLVICSDEIHSDLVYPPHQHIPIAALDPDIAARTISLFSPSKTFNVAGLKTAAAVITNPDLRKTFLAACRGLVGKPNILGTTAFQAAYQSSADWLDKLLVYLGENRQLVQQFIAQELPALQAYPPEGTYLAWVDCRNLNLEDPYQFFLDEAQVAFNPGRWFGDQGKGFVRLNFACPRNTLREGLDRMKSALDSLDTK